MCNIVAEKRHLGFMKKNIKVVSKFSKTSTSLTIAKTWCYLKYSVTRDPSYYLFNYTTMVQNCFDTH